MKIMYALAIVAAGMVATAAAQAASFNPLIGTDHNIKFPRTATPISQH